GDSDLEPLVESFNAMVESLQIRIEREARFASDVTHELRSPLATMGAALSVARRRASEPATHQALDVLGTEVDRFQELIVDLLEIARAEAGVAELSMDEIEPRALAQSVLEASGRDQVMVEVDAEGDRRARLDKRRIGQALVNLLDNADNYGGGATKLTVTGDSEFLRFIVDDDGPGVPEHERDHVFQRFARGTHAEVSGTGLGLALVTEHVRLHHGQISVTDAPGGGARFIIELPREQP
ncbi:MAG: HAMP domain-containing sensor histidine kinase, partial [Aquihabitans sp.]